MPTKPLVILAHVPSEPVTRGFVPAARRLGFPVVLLTDRLEEQQDLFARMSSAQAPTAIVACDVFNPLAVLDALSGLGSRPAAVFSNSDHLQTSTALAANHHGLAGKDWHVTLRAKNKAQMRAYREEQGLERVWHRAVSRAEELPAVVAALKLPCVVKPSQGVASEDVQLARSAGEVTDACHAIWRSRPGQTVLLEEFLEGPLVTLETLGDGEQMVILGGFRTSLSAPPAFVEREAWWGTQLPPEQEESMAATLRAMGVQFGSCHAEFILTAQGPRLVEVNYRSVGDSREFLLDEALELRLFERILQLHLGAPLELSRPAPVAAGIRYLCAEQSGTIKQVPPAFRRREGEATFIFTPSRPVGSVVRLSGSNRDYLGSLRGFGGSEEQLRAAFDRAQPELRWELR